MRICLPCHGNRPYISAIDCATQCHGCTCRIGFCLNQLPVSNQNLRSRLNHIGGPQRLTNQYPRIVIQHGHIHSRHIHIIAIQIAQHQFIRGCRRRETGQCSQIDLIGKELRYRGKRIVRNHSILIRVNHAAGIGQFQAPHIARRHCTIQDHFLCSGYAMFQRPCRYTVHAHRNRQGHVFWRAHGQCIAGCYRCNA